MDEPSLLRRVGRKNSNPATLAAMVIAEPALVAGLLAGLDAPKAQVKYKCEKVLRLAGERRPDILYPHFDFFVRMLECENGFLKWGAIQDIANMARADTQNKFEPIFERYFSPIPGPVMITAANTIGGAAKIALAKPHLAGRITAEILKVEKARYQTAECRNVAIGHAIDSFSRFFELVDAKTSVIDFVKRQLKNKRPAVRRRAETFLKRRDIPF
jgi:hypothetical protein